MAFAPDGSFWIGNIGVLGHPPKLEHFAKGATGNASPIATITCGLAEVTNVAVDKAGNVYALNRQSQTVGEPTLPYPVPGSRRRRLLLTRR